MLFITQGNKLLMSIDISLCAVILCGGAGKRLRKVVHGIPKPMALIAGRPFLDFLIEYLIRFNVRTVILCTGYKSDVIEKYYKSKHFVAKIIISKEDRPLDTAGALKNAAAYIKSNPFFVLNGDSFCNVNLHQLFRFHVRKKANASIVLAWKDDRTDTGAVLVDESCRILKFREKCISDNNTFINAGIYLFDKKVLSLIPKNRKYSLEFDLFPGLDNCYGYKTRAPLLDIGVPERYKMAEIILKKSGNLLSKNKIARLKPRTTLKP